MAKIAPSTPTEPPANPAKTSAAPWAGLTASPWSSRRTPALRTPGLPTSNPLPAERQPSTTSMTTQNLNITSP
eukprot:CAMPEP_0118973656 /NCGR_PEP_ID=MMETSP1173-20130426/10671_1 /TAXON_ID=1034831 /ORGANISM="Rhizochromulina marina cf, Strain CCMP1243" /LENGTH=72 /DNA_ID=CAMNT_0006923343 /DNA_START=321 /DNA_END=535 /DNA_ORIENTATION=+